MIELSGLFSLESVVFSLAPDVEQVAEDEWWCDVENADPDSPKSVGDALGDQSGEGFLLEG